MIRALVSIIPCILVVAACVPLFFYDLTREKHEEIMKLVEIERERKTEIARKSKLPPQSPHDEETLSHNET
jgi:Na+/melibiose symporter-like transporter